MKRLAFAVGVLALGFAASTPARADFAVVKFELGFCRIWWDSGRYPVGRRLDQGRDRADFPAPGPRRTPRSKRATCK